MLPAPSRLSDRTNTTWLPTTFCWASILFASASTFASAEEKSRGHEHPNHAKLSTVADRIVENFMQQKRVPGLVLAALRDGDLVVKKGYGVLSPNDKRQPDSDTLFYIGSLSKAITAVGILLAEQGKLQLNEPASRHLQDLPKSWRRIPLRFFLAHQSGIPQIAIARQPTFERMLRTLDDQPLSFRPGTKQEYNNFNFAVAGQVIEGASGRPYLAFMRDEVFKPLGMARTGYGQIDVNSAPGHYLRPSGQWKVVNDVVPKGGEYGIPSGFLQTTLGDLLRLYRGIRRHKLLSSPRTREMISPVTPGLTGTPGWFAREVNGATIIAKDGAAAGYSSQFQFAKDRGDAVIFIMNLQGKDLDTHALANDLLRDVCGLPIPERRPRVGQGD